VPELPEVETIVRELAPRLRGRRIARVDVRWRRSVDARGLPASTLAGATIEDVRRLGKFIVMRLTDGRSAAVHLRMTGRLIADPPQPLPHTRLVVRFDDGGTLALSDARKFGRLRIFAGDPAAVLGVGVDPYDRSLTPARFGALLAKRTTRIKTWLLDQRFVSGIGNIYACEALYQARIKPTRRAGRLRAHERATLLASLRRVMRKAISHRGSSVDDYLDAEGMPGEFQNHLSVYGRGGLPCRRCRTPIRRVVLGQRGTFFCPACQR
jgi:formamidopyrimidine-DNA glycosylase